MFSERFSNFSETIAGRRSSKHVGNRSFHPGHGGTERATRGCSKARRHITGRPMHESIKAGRQNSRQRSGTTCENVPTEHILKPDEVGSQEWFDRKKRSVIIPHQAHFPRIEYALSCREKRSSCITTISMAGDILMLLWQSIGSESTTLFGKNGRETGVISCSSRKRHPGWPVLYSHNIGCPTSGVAQRAMREAAPHARGVSKASQL
jgi:hypothetical protein